MGLIRKKFEGYPDVEYDRQEFQRIDMQTCIVEVNRFPGCVDKLHRKAIEEEILTHHAPHDTKFRRPTSQTAVGGVGEEGMSRCARDQKRDRPSPSRMELGQIESCDHDSEVPIRFGGYAHFALAPKPFCLVSGFAESSCQGFLAAERHVIAPWCDTSGRP
jgi:hypothetical protein